MTTSVISPGSKYVIEAAGIFGSMDDDGDGILDVHELSDDLSILGMSDVKIKALIEELDIDGNGSLDRVEWLEGYSRFTDMSKDTECLSLFRQMDKSGDGHIDFDELSIHLSDAGMTDADIEGVMMELAPLIDLDGNGSLAIEEWMRGYGKFLEMTRLDQFDELKSHTGGCKIKDSSLRATDLKQLEKIYAFVERQLRIAPWHTMKSNVTGEMMVMQRHSRMTGELTDVDMSDPTRVTFHDLNTFLLRPATYHSLTCAEPPEEEPPDDPDDDAGEVKMERQMDQSSAQSLVELTDCACQPACPHATCGCRCRTTRKRCHLGSCSIVEFMAVEEQRPDYFVSHWWGEPFHEFLLCLRQHARDRKLSNLTRYWIFAFARSQWHLKNANKSVEQKSFMGALKKSKGIVSVVDAKGVYFSRFWCIQELYISLTSKKKNQLHDFYTAFDHQFEHHSPTKGNIKEKRHVVGLTSGLAAIDIEDKHAFGNAQEARAAREKSFPMKLLEIAIASKIADTQATYSEDKERFLSTVKDDGTSPDDLVHGHIAHFALDRALVEAKEELEGKKKGKTEKKGKPEKELQADLEELQKKLKALNPKANKTPTTRKIEFVEAQLLAARQNAGYRLEKFTNAIHAGHLSMKIELPATPKLYLDTEENLGLLLNNPNIKYESLQLSTTCTTMPTGLWKVLSLTSLDLHGSFKQLSPCVGKLSHLAHLTLRDCPQLEGLPEKLADLHLLTLLNIRGCPALKSLPELVTDMCSHAYIHLKDCADLQQVASCKKMQNFNTGKADMNLFCIDEVVAWCEHDDSDVQALGALSLNQLSPAEMKELPEDKLADAVPKLVLRLGHQEAVVSNAAVEVLRKVPVEQLTAVTPLLVKRLSKCTHDVREAVIAVVDHLPLEELIAVAPSLLPHTEGDAKALIRVAKELYGQLPPEEAIIEVATHLQLIGRTGGTGDFSSVSVEDAEATREELCHLSPHELQSVVQHLLPSLEHHEEHVQVLVVKVLSNLPRDALNELIPRLHPLLSDSDKLRRATIRTLLKLPPSVLLEIPEFLWYPDAREKILALLDKLPKAKLVGLVPQIASRLNALDTDIRTFALAVLTKVPPTELVRILPELQEASRDREACVRKAAVGVLSRLPAEDSDNVSNLRYDVDRRLEDMAEHDVDSSVRDAASHFIRVKTSNSLVDILS